MALIMPLTLNLEERSKELTNKYYFIKSKFPSGSNVCPLGIAQMVVISDQYCVRENKIAETFMNVREKSKIQQGINDIVNADLSAAYLIGNLDLDGLICEYNSTYDALNSSTKFRPAEVKYLASSTILYGLNVQDIFLVYDEVKSTSLNLGVSVVSPVGAILSVAKLRDDSSINNLIDEYLNINKFFPEKVDQASKARLSVTLNKLNVSRDKIKKAYMEISRNSILMNNKISKNSRAILVDSLLS